MLSTSPARSVGVTPVDMLSKIVKVPGLALLATIGFLLLNYCSSVDGYEHHRWRHRDHSHFDISPDMRDSRSFGFGLCSRCPPGFGVARRCTLVQDTVCHSCPQGYYAPSYSRKHACWPCSRCGEGLYEVRPCTSTSDTVCDACLNPPHFGNHPEEERSEAHEAQVAANTDYERQCGHRNNAPSQQRNLLSTLTIADNGKKRTTSGNLIHFLGPNAVAAASASDLTNSLAAAGNSSENAVPTGSFPSETNDEEVALGVAQLAAFQVVLIFTAVAAILALTCRLRVFSSHEPARLKLSESYRDDGVALI